MDKLGELIGTNKGAESSSMFISGWEEDDQDIVPKVHDTHDNHNIA
jgi:hypothetical protein